MSDVTPVLYAHTLFTFPSRHAYFRMRSPLSSNLPNDVREGELGDIFRRYGRIRLIDIKWPPKPPPFAFIEFDDPRDAEDAVRGEDGKNFAGDRMRVEIAKGGRRGRDEGGFGGGRGPRRGGDGFRIMVSNVPKSSSWQDIKDHFRTVAPPAFVDIIRGGGDGNNSAVVEFSSMDDAKDAVHKMDNTEFRGRDNESVYIRVEMDGGGGGGDGGRSPPRGGRSPPRNGGYGSPPRDRFDERDDRGRERSRSPAAW